MRDRLFRSPSLIARKFILIAACLVTLTFGTPAFGGPPTIYTVTFAENDNLSDPVSTYQTGTAAMSLTTFSSLIPTFANSGYNFTGWNTAPDGNGTAYSNGATYSFAADVELYAQWAPPPLLSATFYENGGTGSISSIDGQPGTSMTLPSNLGILYSGYTFMGWNTAANGSGSSYAAGSAFVLNANQVFYAQWSANQYVVSFSPNGGTVNVVSSVFISGGTPLALPVPSNIGFAFDGWFTLPSGGTLVGAAGASFQPLQSVTLYAQWTSLPLVVVNFASNGGVGSISSINSFTGTSLVLPGASIYQRTGFTLSSWNSSPDGTGVSFGLGESIVIPSAMTFYAQWTPLVTISVNFDVNGGGGSMGPLNGYLGSSITLPGAPSLTRVGFTLTSWNTSANGTGSSFALGEGLALSSSLTLFAQWTALAKIELSFAVNGGRGTEAPLFGFEGASLTLPSSSSIVKPGFTLASWNTMPNGAGITFALNDTVLLTTSMTLYAHWKATPTAELYGAVGLFTKGSTQLNAGMKVDIQKLAAFIKSKGYKRVTLFGYSAATSTKLLDLALSTARARNVANYLQTQLHRFKVGGVTIRAAGEGSIMGSTSPTYSRVEVFVL